MVTSTREPGSVKFIEASWVANPAFTGAVLRSILNADEIEGVSKKLQVAFSQGPRTMTDMALLKAAPFAELYSPNSGAFLVEGFENLADQLGIAFATPAEAPWGNDFNFEMFAQDQGQGQKEPPQDSGESGAEAPKKVELCRSLLQQRCSV